MSPATQTVGGPFFDDLHVGLVADSAPSLTLTEGVAAAHGAIVGDRMRLALDAELSRRVLGSALAHPALVWDVANGQSTLFTQRVIANLFYRGFMFHRAPSIGDTLYTKTEVVALRQNRARPGRAATGLAALRVRTTDQKGRAVLDYTRCAMLPLRNPEGHTGHDANLEKIGAELDPRAMRAPIEGWDLAAFRAAVPGLHFAGLAAGTIWEVTGGDVVSAAPELARLTLNIAMAHHDAASSSAGRLVYGGHTIGLAAAQATRALPNLVTIVAWHGCDHLAPVREGDTLRSTIELERAEPFASSGASRGASGGGGLVHLRSRVRADREGGSQASQEVLDWRFVGVMA
jgi:acyl dehydratase